MHTRGLSRDRTAAAFDHYLCGTRRLDANAIGTAHAALSGGVAGE
jgi:hypothetical protein